MAVKQSIIEALPTIAAEIGSKFGVCIKVGGKDAYTDGQCICIPEPGIIITETQLLGFLTHEAAHVRFTNFSLPAKSPLEHMLTNAVEDARIEHDITEIFPGAVRYLKALNKKCADEFRELPDEQLQKAARCNPAVSLAMYMAWKGQADWNRMPVSVGIAGKFRDLVVKRFGGDIADACDGIVADLPKYKTTEDVQTAVRGLIAKLRKLASSSSALQSQGDGGEKQSGDQPGCGSVSALSSSNGEECAEDGSADGSHSPEGESNGTSKGRGQSQGGGSGENTGNGGEAGGEAQHRASAGSSIAERRRSAAKRAIAITEKQAERAKGAADLLKDELAARAREQDEDGGLKLQEAVDLYNPSKVDGFRSLKQTLEPSLRSDKEQRGKDLIAKSRVLAGRLSRSLQGFVQSESRRRIWTADRGQRLVKGVVARAVVGSTRLFERRAESRAVKTAVHILMDLSLSMQSKQDAAIEAALGIVSALMRIPGVNPALSAFQGWQFESVVPHGQKTLIKYAADIGMLCASGSTPLGESLMLAGTALRRTSSARHVLIVVTDGFADDMHLALNAVKRLEASDVEVIGIGLSIDSEDQRAICMLFKRHIFVDKVEELASALFNEAKQLLGRGIAANRRSA